MSAELKWYVVHTYSGYEEKAKLSLMERVRNAKMDERFGEVIVPTTMKESVSKKGKKKKVASTQFPGYMLVQMDTSDEARHLLKNTPRITGFVGNQNNPRPLPDNEVMRLTQPEAVEESSAQALPEIEFEKGENVKVIEGPFSSFDGVVDEVKPDKARLRVLVSIFGRETPVELEYRQVEKLS